ncbi:MAG: LuxR C-terminal-related transcriptional regulator [Coriobacteriaceae bacterium]|nr:LuxR C-terminal-related transcriptional regulator [Coriobacteriaceae bacterium]
MKLKNLLLLFKPNVASLGFALFLAINATGVWGGVFPFLPTDFQRPEILFWFFLAQALFFSASYFLSALGSYFVPAVTRVFLISLSAAPYLLGWGCLIAAIYLSDFALPLVIVGGVLLGLGSAGFYMLWQRFFASQDPDIGNRDLIAGMAWAAPLYFLLYLIPVAVTTFLIPVVFLPLFGLALLLKTREIDREQPMYQDRPREHPKVYRQVLHVYWRSALCLGALGFCTGIMRSLAIGDPEIGSLVNILSMAGLLIVAVALLIVWQFNNIHLNVIQAYRVAFPLVITSLLLLPFLPTVYERWLAAILYAVYMAAIMIMMIQCAQASRDRGVNPVFIYGFFGGIVYILHDIGFISGTFAEGVSIAGLDSLTLVTLFAVYLLGIMYFIGEGGFRNIFFKGSSEAADIELVSPRPPSVSELRAETTSTSDAYIDVAPPTRPTAAASPDEDSTELAAETRQTAFGRHGDGDPIYQDRISKQAALLQRYYRLSARETEVMELIVRGNTVARIAEDLVVSENTIRTHAKRIYAKLSIHKRQELVDLINSFDPHDIKD